MAIPLVAVAVIIYPYLPPGICFGDNGDLQSASVTLGIMHSPGYPGFTTLGYLVSRIPFVDKPFLVTLGCLGSGLALLWISMLIQLRLGVHVILAATVALLFAAHKRFWFNVITPEVYMPALAFLATAVYLLMHYSHSGCLRSLVLSAFFAGFCVANRSAAVLTIPFFFAAFIMTERRLGAGRRRILNRCGLVTLCGLVPCLYSVGYVILRDRSNVAYNYIEFHNADENVLPDPSDGPVARIRRATWLLTAEQFHSGFGTTWVGLWRKLRWLGHELLHGPSSVRVSMLVLVVTGLFLSFRRHVVTTILVGGMGLYSIVFVSIYRVYGQAADLAPLVFTIFVFLGVVLSAVDFGNHGRRFMAATSLLLAMIVVAVWTSVDLPARLRVARDADAIPFLNDLDIASVPNNALILTGWGQAAPLWYASRVLSDRPDIQVVSGEPGALVERARQSVGRPVLMVDLPERAETVQVESFRNVWRVR